MELREFTAQVVIRTPRATIQHYQSGGGVLDGYYGGVDETHFGPADDLRDPRNPGLAPDQVSIKPQGKDAVVLDVDLDPDARCDGGETGTWNAVYGWRIRPGGVDRLEES